MRRYLSALVAAGLWAAVCAQPALASGTCPKPACEPGYTIVEEIVYKEVIKKRCVPAPDVQKKTKWVYECRSEDFCVKKCSLGQGCAHGCGQGCGASCTHCDRPMTRNLLVKKLVVEECPSDKCVIETYVEKVPCKVYRKVPCGTAHAPAAAAVATPATTSSTALPALPVATPGSAPAGVAPIVLPSAPIARPLP